MRSQWPKITRWVLMHQSLVATAAPFVFLVWCGGIWALLIFKGSYDNIVAMFGASLLMCMGVLFFFFKRKH
jgi:hypothetical protein